MGTSPRRVAGYRCFQQQIAHVALSAVPRGSYTLRTIYIGAPEFCLCTRCIYSAVSASKAVSAEKPQREISNGARRRQPEIAHAASAMTAAVPNKTVTP